MIRSFAPDINLKGEIRPPRYLPKGKLNPAYSKWWASTETGRYSPKNKERRDRANKKYRQHSARWKRAHLALQKKWNDESLMNATLIGQEWDLVDEVYLLENVGNLKLRDMAVELGRSYASVRSKLQKLRKREAEGGQIK